VFGEKDYQQLQVIKRFVSDLDIPVEILSGPTLREADGLAMSSRNRYLSEAERAVAPELHRILVHMVERIKSGQEVESALGEGREALTQAGFRVDYLELRDAESLAPVIVLAKPTRLLVAAFLGTTRLIDNMAV
jgi:pantoate--beta-alanine ligase